MHSTKSTESTKAVWRKAGLFVVAALMTTVLFVVGPPAADANPNCDITSATINLREGPDCDSNPATRMRLKTSFCVGGAHHSIGDAKASYAQRCDETWRYNSGHHRCVWANRWGSQRGWLCFHQR